MSKRVKVGLIHTTIAAVGPMVEEFAKAMPEADLLHFLDEGLVVEFGRAGGLSRASKFRTLQLARAAEAAGAEIITCSCSTLSPAFPDIEPFVGVPIISIDQAMAEEACRVADEITITATAESVLKSVLPTFAKAAEAVGRSPVIKTAVITEARRHPRGTPEFFRVISEAVSEVLTTSMPPSSAAGEGDSAVGSSIVAVAQCSMSGCLPLLADESKDRVLWGAPYAVRAVKARAEQLGP